MPDTGLPKFPVIDDQLKLIKQHHARWFPEKRKADDVGEHTFEIALVLAGAVSAGAYTAGVMDFLIEALDAWHDARAAGEAVPKHKVKLRIVTGASAGGINGAILAATARDSFPPVRPDADEATKLANPYYYAWVKRIDIAKFLSLDDLADDKIESLLNCNVLDTIADELVTYPYKAVPAGKRTDADKKTRGWLDDPFKLTLTVSNLRGVPYSMSFSGATKGGHDMLLHADTVSFGVPVFNDVPKDHFPPDTRELSLNHARSKTGPAWKAMGTTALATGAFPVGLKPRALSRSKIDYLFRFVSIQDGGVSIARPSSDYSSSADMSYSYLNVDGGAMNNEPFELARRYLAGSKHRNPREAEKANRAVIMIDPFPEGPSEGPDSEGSLVTTVKGLFRALINQARFKGSDLALIQDNAVYSRYLIAPKRSDDADGRHLASGGLGAFLGFFHEDYRHHDYMLGRINCQAFLKNWFGLPQKNKAFDEEDFEDGVMDAYKQPVRLGRNNKSLPDHFQIIPLIGSAAEWQSFPNAPSPHFLPKWPAGALTGYADFEQPIKARVKAVYKALKRSATKAPEAKGPEAKGDETKEAGTAAEADGKKPGFFGKVKRSFKRGWKKATRFVARKAIGAYISIGWLFGKGQLIGLIRDELDAAVKKVNE